MESVSASSTVSNQTAEKVRAAVANFYDSYERRDAAGPDKWMVMTDDRGNKFGLGNPAKDAFVRQFMWGLKKRKNKEFTQRQATPISLDALCASFSLDTYVRIHRGKPFVVFGGICFCFLWNVSNQRGAKFAVEEYHPGPGSPKCV
ncbi:hypothetical protein F441_06458 [Phytophthora nicotianae CJ01A1]|uniref:Uncharacterized protein n=1 Tax=Phytophthora nicotianae CJ01A1 TaxID=1317063 RepID=W2XA71_PHYNI|nr:hypothetical protein F441_06458 [Phytophthora nicotianae CJ01A1]